MCKTWMESLIWCSFLIDMCIRPVCICQLLIVDILDNLYCFFLFVTFSLTCPIWTPGSNVPWFMCWFWCYINVCLCVYLTSFPIFFLPYFFLFSCFSLLIIYFLTCLLHDLSSTPFRIDPFCFQARGRRSQPKPGFSFLGSFYVVEYFVMDGCMLLLCLFQFSVLSQEIGWEERLWNDLFCVGWDVEP